MKRLQRLQDAQKTSVGKIPQVNIFNLCMSGSRPCFSGPLMFLFWQKAKSKGDKGPEDFQTDVCLQEIMGLFTL